MWVCSKRCGWVDASAHFERFDGDPCPGCNLSGNENAGKVETVERCMLCWAEPPRGTVAREAITGIHGRTKIHHLCVAHGPRWALSPKEYEALLARCEEAERTG